jgi:hypothetical protein
MADSQTTTRRRFVHAATLAATVPAVLALPAPSMVAQAAEPDPIFAAIEAHRRGIKRYMEDLAFDMHLASHEKTDETEERIDASFDRHAAELLALFTTKPTTMAGVAAILDYVTQPAYSDREGDDWEDTVIGDTLQCGADTRLSDLGLAARGFLNRIAQAVQEIATEA